MSEMSFVMQLFLILLLGGIMLIGAEIFVPGGILGTLGTLALLGAIAAGYRLWGATTGSLVALLIILLLGTAIIVWLNLFPHTPIGKALTISSNLSNAHNADETLPALLGKSGTAVSDLRPGGIAVIEGRRIDVVSEGGMIDRQKPVRVVKVEGNKVVVRQDG